MTVVSQAEFARMHGVSKKTVTTWKARDWLVLADGGVDVKASNALLKKYRRDGLPGNAEGNDSAEVTIASKVTTERKAGETPSQAAERIALSAAPYSREEAIRIKENYLALLNQLDYDQKSGAVVAVSEVATAVGASYARVRTRLLAIPAEQAPKLHRLKTVNEVQDALLEMITRALEELTRGPAGVGG
jgi:phage terminase Nu1 subunit (DNA packaging protein)